MQITVYVRETETEIDSPQLNYKCPWELKLYHIFPCTSQSTQHGAVQNMNP